MIIGVLGWGSLLWSPRALRLATEWQISSLTLPLEFSRLSSGNRLTLVIDERTPLALRVAFATSSFKRIPTAVRNLATREGCGQLNIGLASALEVRARVPALGIRIRDWAVSEGLDAVIWTDLAPNMPGFSVEAAARHLTTLKREDELRAATYVALSPAAVETPLRRHLREGVWANLLSGQLASQGAKPTT